jgi:hypothetical protein
MARSILYTHRSGRATASTEKTIALAERPDAQRVAGAASTVRGSRESVMPRHFPRGGRHVN